MVIAVREGSLGTYIGFEVDREILTCNQCKAEYLIRYTKDEQAKLPQHRLAAHRAIVVEHPKYSDQVRVQ